MRVSVSSFLRDASGAVSVDWTVLSAAAVAMSLATVGVLNGGLQTLISRLDGELRAQTMNDSFVIFTSAHFEPLYATNTVSARVAEDLFVAANARMNHEILDTLRLGIEAFEMEQLRPQDVPALFAAASVAAQRNILPDSVLDYYFGFGGTRPMITAAPTR